MFLTFMQFCRRNQHIWVHLTKQWQAHLHSLDSKSYPSPTLKLSSGAKSSDYGTFIERILQALKILVIDTMSLSQQQFESQHNSSTKGHCVSGNGWAALTSHTCRYGRLCSGALLLKTGVHLLILAGNIHPDRRESSPQGSCRTGKGHFANLPGMVEAFFSGEVCLYLSDFGRLWLRPVGPGNASLVDVDPSAR